MRIAVYIRHYIPGRIGGQENYLRAVVRGLADRGHSLTIFAQERAFGAVRAWGAAGVTLATVAEEGRAAWRQVAEGGFDALFCPLHMLEPPAPPVPAVVMVPDIQHEFFPEYFSDDERARRRRGYEASARRAAVVLTCSEFSKRTLVERYRLDAGRVRVYGHGVDDGLVRGGQDSLELPAEYVYLPAVYWPHKNHETVLRALAVLKGRDWRELHLVCSGGDGPERARVERLAAELGVADRVRLLGRVADGQVAELYRRSRGLVFPTLFEGFGIPVLEALALGVPVLTARGGAAEEVAGGCAVLVDPRSVESVADGMEELLRNGARLVEAGRRRAAEFSWGRAADGAEAALWRAVEDGGSAGVEPDEWPVISVAVMPGADAAGLRGERVEVVGPEFAGATGLLRYVLRPGVRWLPGTAEAVGRAWRRNPRAGLFAGRARVRGRVVGEAPVLYEDLGVWGAVAGAAVFERVGAGEGLRAAWAYGVEGIEEVLVECEEGGAAWGAEEVRAVFGYAGPGWMGLWRGFMENAGWRRRYLRDWWGRR